MIRKARTDADRGMSDDESLIEVLTLLSGTNLRSAGRVRFDGGDEEFVFSVQHNGRDSRPDVNARRILHDNNFEAEVYEVRDFELDHRQGTLLEKVRELEEEKQEPVIEVYIGAAERNGKIPVQLVTRSMLNR